LIKKRAYIDGVWDLFHIGHLKLFKKIKKKFGYLIVGVHSDKLATKSKRKPVIPHKDRVEIIKSIKYVDEVIENVPFLTLRLINKHNIEAVATTNTTAVTCDAKDKRALEKLKMFYEFKSPKYHSSDIIKKIKTNL
jgi:cytidyltransferase-like protein